MVSIFSNYLNKNSNSKNGTKQQQQQQPPQQQQSNMNDNENTLHSPRQHPGAVLLGNVGNNVNSFDMGILDSFSNDLRLTSVKSNFSSTTFDPFYNNNGNNAIHPQHHMHTAHDDIISITKEDQLSAVNIQRGTQLYSEQNNVIDNLLPSLNEDVLQYTKMKLDSLTKTGYLSPTNMGSPQMNYNQQMVNGFDLNEDVAPINSEYVIAATMSAPQLPTVSPMMNSNSLISNQQQQNQALVSQAAYDNIQMNSLDYLMGQPSDEDSISRVTSAATANNQQINSVYDYLSETKRPMTPLVSSEQLRRQQQNAYSPKQDKFNVLNNRTRHPTSPQPHNSGNSGNNSNYHHGHSNSYHQENGNIKSPKRALSPQHHHNQPNNNTTNTTTPSNNNNNTMTKDVLCQEELLNDIPAWLKTLRLHKYTSILEQYKWQELIQLDDAKLEELGVNALGARNKLLKAFNVVKEGIKQ
ncbi:hypothetical protein ACO0SA_003063 [Hanseniaspora valbyensis]